MKAVNKKFIMIVTLLMVVFSNNVFASEDRDIYYTNEHYVSFTKEEYDFVSDFYYDGYQEYMNQEDYNYMIDSNMMNSEIQTVEYTDNDGLLPFADTSYATGSKRIKLSSACESSFCNMAITLNWLVSPKVRSYDLIGAYSPSSNSLSIVNSRVQYDGTSSQYVERREEKNGISATMKLPSSGEGIRVIMNFTANKGTTIFASYQHAAKTITLANSRKYSFLGSGYGGVFRFEESIKSYYDAMRGVEMTI